MLVLEVWVFLNPGITQNSKQIFQELVCKLEKKFLINRLKFSFSSFLREGCIKIHKLKQWVKFQRRVNAKTPLNNWPQAISKYVHGGDRTYDLWNANPMPCKLS